MVLTIWDIFKFEGLFRLNWTKTQSKIDEKAFFKVNTFTRHETGNLLETIHSLICDELLMVADSEKWSLGPFPLYMCGRRLLAGGHDMSGHYTRSSKIGSSLTSRGDLSTETWAPDFVGVSKIWHQMLCHLWILLWEPDAIFRTPPQNLMPHYLSPF